MDSHIIPPPPPPPQNKPDKKARKEEKSFADADDLEKKGAANKFNRDESTRSVVALLAKIIIIAAGLVLAGGVIVWAIHILAPESWRWLSEGEVVDIQKLTMSALLGMVASDYGKRLIS